MALFMNFSPLEVLGKQSAGLFCQKGNEMEVNPNKLVVVFTTNPYILKFKFQHFGSYICDFHEIMRRNFFHGMCHNINQLGERNLT